MEQYVAFITHHWILSSLFVAICIALLVNEWMNRSFGIAEITPEQAVQLMNHQAAHLLDIRGANAFLEGHILGSQNVPIASLENKLTTLQKLSEKPLIVVCTLGNDARKVGTTLKQKGFQIFVLKGGIQAWKTAGMPLVKAKS